MKLLIVIDAASIANALLTDFGYQETASFSYKQLEIQVVITGASMYETGFHMANALRNGPFHLVLQLGRANTWSEDVKLGEVVNVINDKPGFYGIEGNNKFHNAYALEWLDASKKPHVRGGYINMTNAYFNVFLPFQKVASITTPTLQGKKDAKLLKTKAYPHHCETTNGLAFQHACLYHGVSFYQLRVVVHHFSNEAETIDGIIELKESLQFILNKL